MRNILRKNTPPGLAPEPAEQASSGRHLLGVLPNGPGHTRSGRQSRPGGVASHSLLRRRHAIPVLALFAVLAFGLLFLLPGGLLQAQSAEQFIAYPENGEGPVATFTASDPEGAMPVYWSITDSADPDANVVGDDIADRALFKIDQNGVLSFMDSPNYEAPADTNNEYRVTVQASDGEQISYFEVYVNVTDEEEAGKVTWAVDPDGTGSVTVPAGVVLRQFQPGASLTASVTDPDAVTSGNADGDINSGITWKWYRGSSLISGQITNVYTVMDGDVGNTIRVMATYTDGKGPEESVSLTSASVQTFRRSNTPPAFATTTVTRRIAENSTGNIGGPVVATDTDGDTLTYAFGTGGDDNDSFRIDPATGQLMVGPGLMIDFEDADNTSYTVAVFAYDSSGATAPAATVTINVIDEDEKPEFGETTDATPPANVMRSMVAENVMGNALNIAVYTATDPEDESVSLSLMGDDAGLFELNDLDTPAAGSKILAFKKSPDFEMPGDRNDDNLYEVTVRASDGTMSADRMVVVKVTNVVEGGKVTLSPEDAVPGVELTATLMDPEGGVSASGQITGERWTWHRAATEDFTASDANDIDDETSPTYTPVSGDVGQYLRAMVSYDYQGGAEKTGVSAAVLVQTSRDNQAPRFKEGASTFRVVMESVAANDSDDPANQDDVADDNIGMPVEATDANADMVAYTLGGADASLFRIRSNGQLEVKGKLDHEADSSHTVTVMANDGSGGSNATDSITVTIYVTDVDEAPKIRDRAAPSADGQRTVSYAENGDGYVARFTASDPEGAMPVYWSITDSADPDANVVGDDIADRALFKIDQNGVLSFMDSPNYEAPADTNNEYRVTVQASDGEQISYFEVYVNVTDTEETGKVTWAVDPDGTGSVTVPAGVVLRQFQPGASLTASVTDPDAVTSGDADGDITSGITWKWYRGSSLISGQITNVYTVVDGDPGSTIRVMATYTDGSGPEEDVSLTSASVLNAIQLNNAPTFASATVTRRITENSMGNIGGPVAATDSDSGDTLTYAFGTGGDDNDSFRIDPATGQLMVGPGLMIDFEDADNTSYTVAVFAYDSSGATAPAATVTINVIDEDEKPEFGETTDATPPANVMRSMVAENVMGNALNIAVYTATDPEDESVSLSLMGDDAGLFELNDLDTPAAGSKILAFKKSPDFEMPGDRNDDNLYEVTVRASDGTMSADRMVVVKVTNVVEGGKVTLSPEDAVPGVELTATLMDPEGGVSASGQITGERWTWHRAATEDFTASDANDIDDETSPTYTPVSGDVGQYLRAMVSYDYQGGAEKTGVSAAVLVQTSRDNQAPRFKEGASTFRVVMESVAANDSDDPANQDDVADDNIGMPVEATDANADMVAYTLGGADASLFRIRSNGQLEVKGKLDHEADSSHTVTVMANDGSGGSNATDSITVTIYVTDVDEGPEITVGGLVISGRSSIDYAENRGDAVATYTATGPNAASAGWSLDGADAGDFRISSGGALTFRSSPNFDSPADADMDNVYEVTIEADDGTYQDTLDVTITVTEVMEPNRAPAFSAATAARSVTEGTVAGGNVGTPVTATDPDSGDTLTYTLSGTDAESFDIDSTNGQITVGQGTTLDADTKATYTVIVTATDPDELSDAITVTITVTMMTARIPGDANNDGMVDKPEVIAAFRAYVLDPSDKTEMIAIFRQYVADSAAGSQ